ncbi:MAG: LysE family translocator [Pseudomonadota bacterium]
MDWSDIYTFTVVAFLLVASPGPNGILIAKTVPRSGRAAGFANVVGFVSAFYLHGALSILGISVILLQSATAFTVIKYLGVGYLFWIGIKALVSVGYSNIESKAVRPSVNQRTLIQAYLEGFLTNALNPKVSMFYLAAFPQFISTSDSSATSAFFLVFIHSLLNAIWFGTFVVLFASLSSVTRSPGVQKWISATTGIVFAGFGLKLAAFDPDN